jgi:hypothetical protein
MDESPLGFELTDGVALLTLNGGGPIRTRR